MLKPPYPYQAPPLLHSFLIGEDGHVYEGRGWNIKGDHTGPIWNPMSIGITFMGNFMGKYSMSWTGDGVGSKGATRSAVYMLIISRKRVQVLYLIFIFGSFRLYAGSS